MRYYELLETAETVSTMMYHVTTDNRLKSIMQVGLEPNRHRRWKNNFGATLGDRGFIYLMADFTAAVRFAGKQNYYNELAGKRMKSVILCLRNVPREGLVRDDNIEGQLAGNTWWKSPAVIPPHDIVRVIPLTLELRQQAVGAAMPGGPPVVLPPEEAPSGEA